MRPEGLSLGQINALASGPDGRIYATDAQRLAVRVFDAALQPIGLGGRDGSGPAELRYVHVAHIRQRDRARLSLLVEHLA